MGRAELVGPERGGYNQEPDMGTETTIVYIMGRGHSGSTILDLVMGNHEEMRTVGELTNGFRVAGVLCSCGARLDECEFWRDVRAELRDRHPETSFDDYSRMLAYVAKFYRIPQIVTGFALPSEIVLMNEGHARAIWQFVQEWCNKVETIVVHCEQGMSRSPAVAAAICKVLGDDDRQFFREYMPNRYICDLLMTVAEEATGER